MRMRYGDPWRFCSRPLILEALEERIVLDAGAPDICQDQGADPVPVDPNPAQAESPVDAGGQEGPEVQSSAVDPLDAIYDQPLNVVLISGGIGEIDAIKDAVAPGAKVVVYDAWKDGMSDVVSALVELAENEGDKIGALAIISHGDPASVMIGTSAVGLESFFKYEAAFETLAQTLSEGAQIQLYGCSTAFGDDGEALLDRIAEATGATVFGSVDDTGGLDANWTLEYSTDPGAEFRSLINEEALTDLEVELIFPNRPPLDQNATTYYTYYGILDDSDPEARYSPYEGVTRYAEVWTFTVPVGGQYVSIGMQTPYPDRDHNDSGFVDAWIYLYSGSDPTTGTLLYQRDDFQGTGWSDSVNPPRAKYSDSLVRGDDPDGNGQYDIWLTEGTYSIEATVWTDNGYEDIRFGPYYLVSTAPLTPVDPDAFHFEGLGYLPKPDAWRGEGTAQISLADMDGDGDNDAVAANWGACWDPANPLYEVGQQNRLFLNDGTGTFAYFGQFGNGPTFNGDTADYYTGVTKAVALGDIDHDAQGKIDVVEGNLGLPTVGEANRYYLNQGMSGGTWLGLSAAVDLTGGALGVAPTTSLALADLNRDGYLDVVAGNLGVNATYLNQGSNASGWRGFANGQAIQADVDMTTSIAVADVNGDNWPDLIAGNVSYDPINGTVTGAVNKVYINQRNNSGGVWRGFGAAVTIGADADITTSVDLADMNWDGRPDLIVGNDGVSKVYLNQGGTGTGWLGFGAGKAISSTVADTRDIAVMDTDADGVVNLLITVNDGQPERVYRNEASITYTEVYDLGMSGGYPYSRYGAVGDVDEDGLPDVIIVNDGQLSETYLYKNGPLPSGGGGSGPPVTPLAGAAVFGAPVTPVADAAIIGAHVADAAMAGASMSGAPDLVGSPLLAAAALIPDTGLTPAFQPTTEAVILEPTATSEGAFTTTGSVTNHEGFPVLVESTSPVGPSLVASLVNAVVPGAPVDGAVEGVTIALAPGGETPASPGLTGMEGYASGVAQGKALVFNMSEINAVDFVMGAAEGLESTVAGAVQGTTEDVTPEPPLALIFDMSAVSFLDWA